MNGTFDAVSSIVEVRRPCTMARSHTAKVPVQLVHVRFVLDAFISGNVDGAILGPVTTIMRISDTAAAA
ncbi:MAG: hypothetical protein E2O95_02680 [Acidobacteria bacterium]|nr:MAG: hypothetical protein E2O95_02680 [Acidobacteriota bacterium]